MRLPTPLLRRRNHLHKNHFGHLLVIAGSSRMLGAAALTALAAMRSGVGLVTVAVPASLNNTLQKKLHPTIMTWPLPDQDGFFMSKAATIIIKNQDKYTAVALGPGLGVTRSTKGFVRRVLVGLNHDIVVDADGLNNISDNVDVLHQIKKRVIITPHEGEMGRLLKKKVSFVHEQRRGVITNFVQQFDRVVGVLKGPHTLVASKGKRLYMNDTGNVGLAKAGSGDVLTGLISALLAQGVEPFEAAKVGVYLHGLAADLAVSTMPKASLLATDVIDGIPQAIKKAASR